MLFDELVVAQAPQISQALSPVRGEPLALSGAIPSCRLSFLLGGFSSARSLGLAGLSADRAASGHHDDPGLLTQALTRDPRTAETPANGRVS